LTFGIARAGNTSLNLFLSFGSLGFSVGLSNPDFSICSVATVKVSPVTKADLRLGGNILIVPW
jgi:hypothetical protein